MTQCDPLTEKHWQEQAGPRFRFLLFTDRVLTWQDLAITSQVSVCGSNVCTTEKKTHNTPTCPWCPHEEGFCSVTLPSLQMPARVCLRAPSTGLECAVQGRCLQHRPGRARPRGRRWGQDAGNLRFGRARQVRICTVGGKKQHNYFVVDNIAFGH